MADQNENQWAVVSETPAQAAPARQPAKKASDDPWTVVHEVPAAAKPTQKGDQWSVKSETPVPPAPRQTTMDIVKGGAKALGSHIYHSLADEATPEEKEQYAEFEKQNNEAPGTETSGLKRIGLGVQRLTGADETTGHRAVSGVLEGLGNLGSTLYGMGKDIISEKTPVLLSDDPKDQGSVADRLQGDTLINKYLLAPAAAEKKKAIEAPTAVEATGHRIAEFLPFLGPIAAHLAEKAGTGDIAGAVGEGTTYALAPKVAEEAPRLLKGGLKRIPIVRDIPEALKNAAETRKDNLQAEAIEKAITPKELFPGGNSDLKTIPNPEAGQVEALKIAKNPIAYPLGKAIADQIKNFPHNSPLGSVLKGLEKPKAIPYEDAPNAPSTRLERIESVIPEAGNIIQNVEAKAEQFGAKLPQESAEVPQPKPGLRPIDLGPLLEKALDAKTLDPKAPIYDRATQGKTAQPVATVDPEHMGQNARIHGTRMEGAIEQHAEKFGQDPELIRMDVHGITNAELGEIAARAGVDMGNKVVSRAQGNPNAMTRTEVFNQLLDRKATPKTILDLKNNPKWTMDDKGIPRDEFGNPPVSGGSGAVVGGPDTEGKTQPTFYSKVERVAKEKVNNGSGNSILSTLRNNGVKESEIQWMGLDDYLKDKPKVSKEDVARYIAENKIQLNDVDLGDTDETRAAREQLNQLSRERDKLYAENNRIGADELRYADHRTELFNSMSDNPEETPEQVITRMPEELRGPARRFVETDRMIHDYDKQIIAAKKPFENIRPVKYEKYTLPGEKSNYGEKLLTIPQDDTSTANRLEWAKNHRGKWAWFHGEDQVSGAYPEESDRENARQSIKLPEGVGQFKSTHFEEPNVVAHVRYDDRPSPDGKKTLFLEEVQSDWHAQGKQGGYKQGKFGVFDSRLNSAKPLAEFSSEQEAKNWAKDTTKAPGRFLHVRESGLVPDAPFKSDWHELAMKRMLRHAAENGYERLAWTTGDQQADRYDLSKHIGSVEYDMENKTLIARDPNGRKVVEEEVDPDEDELARYIGEQPAKKLAERIENHPGHPDSDQLWQDYADNYRIKEVADPDDEEGSHYAVTFDGDHDPLETFDTETAAHRYIEDQVRFEVENYEHEPNPSVDGLDLKTGGEWAKALYDRAIPNFLSKYVKKWGAKVEPSSVVTGTDTDRVFHGQEPSESALKEVWRTSHGTLHTSVNNVISAMQDGKSFLDAMDSYGTEELADRFGGKMQQKPQTEKVHSIEITPAMKKSLLQEGQPISKGLRPILKSSPLGRIEAA